MSALDTTEHPELVSQRLKQESPQPRVDVGSFFSRIKNLLGGAREIKHKNIEPPLTPDDHSIVEDDTVNIADFIKAASKEEVREPALALSGKNWSALIYDQDSKRVGIKATDIIASRINECINEGDESDPETDLFEVLQFSHFSFMDHTYEVSADRAPSVSIVKIVQDKNGDLIAVIGHDGPKTNVYAYQDGKVIKLTKANPTNYIGMPKDSYALENKLKTNSYTPTIISVPLPDSAEIFMLTTDVFDLFTEEEIAAYIHMTGNIGKAIERLVAIARDPKKNPYDVMAKVMKKHGGRGKQKDNEKPHITPDTSEPVEEAKGLRRWLIWLESKKPYRHAKDIDELFKLIRLKKGVQLASKSIKIKTTQQIVDTWPKEDEDEFDRLELVNGAFVEKDDKKLQVDKNISTPWTSIIPADKAIDWIKEYLASEGKERADFVHDLPKDLSRMVELFRYFPTNH